MGAAITFVVGLVIGCAVTAIVGALWLVTQAVHGVLEV